MIESKNKSIGILFPDKTIAGKTIIKKIELKIKNILTEELFLIKNIEKKANKENLCK
jgi:hypothetical protein